MTRLVAAASAAVALVVAAAAPPPPAVRARAAHGSLASLISPDDYPPAALRAEEQGLVRVRLDVGKDGLVTGCTIVVSSNSAALDAATCRIFQARARFTPARDRRGRPVADSLTQAITWRIEEEEAAPVSDGPVAWSTCLTGEARAHATDRAAIGVILDRAFEACKSHEAAVVAAFNAAHPEQRPVSQVPKDIREGMRHSTAEMLLALRFPQR